MAEPLFDMDLKEVKRIQRLVDDILHNGKNVEKPLEEFNAYMDGQTEQTFRKGGRGEVEWKPLAAVTVIMRAYRKRGGSRSGPKRILQDTGALKRSIRSDVARYSKGMTTRLFSKSPYAPTHQFGGTMKIPERIITPKPGKKALRFFVGAGRSGGMYEVFAKRVVQPERTVKVPKRPIIFFIEKDIKQAVELLSEHAQGVGKRTTRLRT